MPATRTTPKDVLIRVPKVEPYSNRYVPPSARAREEAKRLAAAAVPEGSTSTLDVGVIATSTTDATATMPPPGTREVIEPIEQGSKERGNSPTLPFLSIDREEERTVELSKAATSSAGWNSLLVWARRQRGAQWDESTALWQVDRGSKEYYSFGENPATTRRGDKQKETTTTTATTATAPVVVEEDEDKGPTRVSARKIEEASGASPPPVSSGRTIRLLRR
ncbi:hypothetical protein PSEUBRA_001956 [Kalmanozyma brasiliensis GHG001]|uniref:Uncharacterized protein n=1 Tax=Kalmanozyma brasiliensis (strain GHG001) TaxID=1365824 RepID=V5ETG9_KALBG|nr:uncharacterized protein PSEUBRA_001956 [Kalmanozyma brasiliensis GHG001]EST08530.1 hypothetical protein PSEUBRA_001956 [Kalmanozyma brasiliensis GHG001]